MYIPNLRTFVIYHIHARELHIYPVILRVLSQRRSDSYGLLFEGGGGLPVDRSVSTVVTMSPGILFVEV